VTTVPGEVCALLGDHSAW